jgi:hypothetical protein
MISQYPANIASMVGTSFVIGPKDIIDRINSQAKACPDQKFALAGYSQGSLVVRMAMSAVGDAGINPDAMKRLVGGATFGDFGGIWPGDIGPRMKVNCVQGDPVSVAA